MEVTNTRKSFEYQYADAFKDLKQHGVEVHNRTGINTLMKQHQYFFIDNVMENFPKLKGKKVYPKMALKETIWMMMGRVDVKWLHEHGVTYWDEWVDENGTIGKTYGYQFRNFNGTDQLVEMLDEMYRNPEGRRHIINLWNIHDLPEMQLPPCMYDYHFGCTPDKNGSYMVDLHSHIRSNDSFLGAPYDFMFCAWFLKIICTYLNIKSGFDKFIPRNIHYTVDDYHVYVNHLEQVDQYLDNIKENKDSVIDSTTQISDLSFGETDKTIHTIDDYLKLIESKIKDIKIITANPTGSVFEYGTISADIAI